MNFQIALIIFAIIATIFLGSVSNWIYDLLKKQGYFPDQANLKGIAIIIFSSTPLVLLIFFSEISDEEQEIIIELLQTPVPIWTMILIVLVLLLVGYTFVTIKVRSMQNLVNHVNQELSSKEKLLSASEAKLEQYLKANKRNPDNVIIKPK